MYQNTECFSHHVPERCQFHVVYCRTRAFCSNMLPRSREKLRHNMASCVKKGIYLRPYFEADFSPLSFAVCCHPKSQVFSNFISYRVVKQNRMYCYDLHFIITPASPVFSGTVVCFTKATSPAPEARQRKAPVSPK
jgi:hypothetical protein